MVPNYLHAWRKHRELSQEQVALMIGSTKNMYGKLERGERTLDVDWLEKLGHAFRCQPYEIIAGAPEADVERTTEATSPSDEHVSLMEWDIAYGMGNGTFSDLPVTGQEHTFSRAWLRNFTHSDPAKVFLARGVGDSMSPTILDSDMVIIDTAEREVRVGDKIWACFYGTTGYIKRIRPMPDGSVKMLSDNPSVPPETAYDGELAIVGRVVAVIRRV